MEKKSRKRFLRPDKLLLSKLGISLDLSTELFAKQKSQAKGSGEVVFIGNRKIDKPENQAFKYNIQNYKYEEELSDFSFLDKPDKGYVYWLNVHGLHDLDLIERINDVVKMERLTVRKIVDTTIRTKIEEHEDYLYFNVKSILNVQDELLHSEHISFVLTKNYVLSFQEEKSDHFNNIRNKITEKLGIIRKKGADYLLYQLLDAILDNYYETIENVNESIKTLEKKILKDPEQIDLVRIERFKQLTATTKKSLTPFKDALRTITTRETDFIQEDTLKYFTDLFYNSVGAMEELDATLNSLDGLANIYFSSLSQKMNEIMKVLTLVSTIFIPLTFVAGIYGMNFEYIPELSYRYGYFVTWGVMLVLSLTMVILFKRKKWL